MWLLCHVSFLVRAVGWSYKGFLGNKLSPECGTGVPLTRVGFLQIEEDQTRKTGGKVDKEVPDFKKKVRLGAINCNRLRQSFLEWTGAI